MKRGRPVLFLVLACALLASACGDKAQQGTVAGGLTGALIGSHLGPDDDEHRRENALIGAGIGALFGYAIGNELDKYDRTQIGNALEYNPSYQSSSWVNPDTRNRFQATPRPAYEAGGQVCRNIVIDAWIDGKKENVQARACRRPDGGWEIVR
jgi:surface antigen